jgi:hypothetical protein
MPVNRVAHAEHASGRIARRDLRPYLPSGDTEDLGVDVLAYEGAYPPVELVGAQRLQRHLLRVVHERQHEFGERLVADQSCREDARQRIRESRALNTYPCR